ncbi:MAG: hypothetical protein AABY22_28465 [Nanoarchaeota archaeon]
MSQSREIQLQRREQVKELWFVRRYSIRQIAKLLNWNYETIWKDIQEIRSSVLKDIEDIDLKKELANYISRNNGLINKAWRDYEKAEKTNEKLQIINTIRLLESDYIHTLEKFGIILPPVQRNVNINVDVTERIKKWCDEVSLE